MTGVRRRSFNSKAISAGHEGVVDAVDRRLIALLREDARMSSRDLAHALGHSEATVRARLRRLEASATVRVVAKMDFRTAGLGLMVHIGVRVKDRAVADVANEIALLPQVLSVQLIVGPMDIELNAGAADSDALASLMATLAAIPGVHRLFPGLALEVVKFDWESVPVL